MSVLPDLTCKNVENKIHRAREVTTTGSNTGERSVAIDGGVNECSCDPQEGWRKPSENGRGEVTDPAVTF